MPAPLAPRLRDLAAFAAAARLASLGAAARALGQSQPAISQAIRRLEARVGTTLLERGARGSFPAEAGARLLARCERMERQLAAGLAACGSTAPALRLTDAAVATHLAIAEAGSLAAAARRRGVTPPTLARTAHGLEAALGVALYRRGAGGVVPTVAGMELARRLALARLEIEQGLAELSAAGAPERLRIGLLPMLSREPFARAIARAGGAVAVTTEDGGHAELLALLRQGRLDAMLGALRRPPLEEVVEEPLRADPYVVACAAGHALTSRGAAALVEAGWVVAVAGVPRRAVAEALFARLPRRPRILLEANAPETTVALLREAGALALLPARLVAATAGLAALPVEVPAPPRLVGLTLRRDWLPTPAQGALLDALRVEVRAG